jgi:hypothetical protein
LYLFSSFSSIGANYLKLRLYCPFAEQIKLGEPP